MPKRKSAGSATDDKIRSAALRFAGEIARMVRSGIAEEVTGQVQRVLAGISDGGGAPVRLVGATRGDGRIGKPPVPVACPFPGCKNVGIRAKRNFCGEHSMQLNESEKAKLREQQLASGSSAPKKSRATGRKRGRPPKTAVKE
jgi:hypothetical protein